MTLDRILGRLATGNPSPLLKQIPTTVVFLLAVVVALVVPGMIVPEPITVASGTMVVILATALAGVISLRRELWHLAWIVPAIDFLAISALRLGTGSSSSAFTALFILPVVWIASEPGRRYIWFATVGTVFALLTPLLIGQGVASSTNEFVRGLFSATAFAIAAAIINELSRHSRLRLESVASLAEQRERMLEEGMEHERDLLRSEAKRRELERLYRGVWMAATEQSIIGTDITGLIDAWNPGASRMLGLLPEETEDKRHIDEFHRHDELDERSRELNYPAGATVLNPGFSALVEQARLGSAEVREWTYVRNDGSTLPVELSVTPRIGDDGEIIGYLFVANDVTRAREVGRLKDEFVGLISHELRTPLSSILGYLELLRDEEDIPLTATQLQYLSVAERNAHRLLRLVGDLLFTAQVESGKFNLDQRPHELQPILSASVESARPVAAAAGVTLRSDVSIGSVVHGDAVRLGQAVDNLISNAIKFTPSGGTVSVDLTTRDDEAVITVTDTGMGIAASELDKLFGRFFRATTATRNAIPGVGLGLTITKAIVVAHRGGLDVQSEEGVGTTFSVTLPLAAEPALT